MSEEDPFARRGRVGYSPSNCGNTSLEKSTPQKGIFDGNSSDYEGYPTLSTNIDRPILFVPQSVAEQATKKKKTSAPSDVADLEGEIRNTASHPTPTSTGPKETCD